MKACPTCGWLEFDEKKKFCYRDGMALTVLPHCQACNREYNVNHDKFCSFCGADLFPVAQLTEPVNGVDK